MITKAPKLDAPVPDCGKRPQKEYQGSPVDSPQTTAHSQACALLRQDLDAQLADIHQAIEGVHLELLDFSKALDRYLAFLSQE